MIVTFLHSPAKSAKIEETFETVIRLEGCYRNPQSLIKAIPMTRFYFSPVWVVEFSRN